MLFKASFLKRIKTGEVTLAFRRWRKPTVRTGGTLRTAIGVLAIDEVVKTSSSEISDDKARRAGFRSREDLQHQLDSSSGGSLYRIAFHLSGPDPRDSLRHRDQLDENELAELQHRLTALDESSRSGPWVTKALLLIARQKGHTASAIAEVLGLPKPTLKRKIRLLKELGLTESLQSGYRLSRRGETAHQKLLLCPPKI